MRSLKVTILLLILPSFCLADTLKSLDSAAIEAVAGSYDDLRPKFVNTDFDRVQDEVATFTPPIARLLLMSGYTLRSNHSREVLSCNNRLDESYTSFTWWRMQEELKKKLPERDVRINENIEEMARRLAKTAVTETAKKREYLMEHR